VKIAVYTILKNEAKNIKGWLNSARGADYIVACDTGSGDESTGLLDADWEAHVHHISIDPWRFDDAHNAALALVPADADVCIPLHLDERLEPGWRELIEAAWLPGTTKLFYTYQFDENYSFLQNRIHARHGYRWKYPDHEGVYPYGNTPEVSVTVAALRIVQRQDRSKDRSGILERLRWGLAEYPNDPRMLHYLGRELMYRGEWREAVQHLEHYLRLPALFPLERAKTAQYLAECWNRLA
jgi:glycosyltransferase involved in cell wall biosynthesis